MGTSQSGPNSFSFFEAEMVLILLPFRFQWKSIIKFNHKNSFIDAKKNYVNKPIRFLRVKKTFNVGEDESDHDI